MMGGDATNQVGEGPNKFQPTTGFNYNWKQVDKIQN